MPTYDVFLSYASADKPAVEALARKLRDGQRLRPFFDDWDLIPGMPWQEALEEALSASRTCAVFLGPAGLGPWHNSEMRVALGQRVEKEPKRVIPVLLPGASKNAIPGFLAQRAPVDFRRGLGDDTACARLVAGIRGVAPGSENRQILDVDPFSEKPQDLLAPGSEDRETLVGDPAVTEPHGENGQDPLSGEDLSWWRKGPLHLGVLGLIVGIIGAVLTTIAWLWPRPPSGPTPDPAPPQSPPVQVTQPAIYSLRVQVLDPDGRPVDSSEVRASVGNEPQRLPDHFWEIEIAAAKVPLDRKVTIWAEHTDWESGRVDLELGNDPNPRAEVRLKLPESRIGGSVVDATGSGVADARITVRDHAAETVVTDRDGKFELRIGASRDQKIRLHVEHSGFLPKDSFCFAGSDKCAVVLESP